MVMRTKRLRSNSAARDAQWELGAIGLLRRAWQASNTMPRVVVEWPRSVPSSRLNVIERWFRDITHNRIRNGVFRSVPELQQAIRDDIEHHNANPKTFVWTKKAEDILKKVARARKALDKILTA